MRTLRARQDDCSGSTRQPARTTLASVTLDYGVYASLQLQDDLRELVFSAHASEVSVIQRGLRGG